MDKRITLLMDLAMRAGAVLRTHFGTDVAIRHKGVLDLVTLADEQAEQLIIEGINSQFPEDGILAEESGRRPGRSAYRWIVDPLDGTTNFASGLPHFAVSMALAEDERVVAGVVYDPVKEECFSAIIDRGAFLNGDRISVCEQRQLEEALVVTGFSYDRRERADELLARVRKIFEYTRGMRRLGSAALDLAYVAAGRFDLFLEDGLNPWDLAAGQLIVTEAGGVVRNFSGQGFALDQGEIVACHGFLLDEAMQKLV